MPPDSTSGGLAVALHSAVARSGRRVVVVDDDPTGSQTVHDVPIVTGWTVEDLTWGLEQDATALFVLTNSRALAPSSAAGVNREVARNLAAASRATGVPVSLVSRSDSVLRGHFPAETDALAQAWTAETGERIDGVLLCPAFVEAGRFTEGDVHWVEAGGVRTPAGETEYARDASFGYRSSDLREWVEERTGGRVRAEQVRSVGLEDVRGGGVDHVAGLLEELSDGSVAVLNAVTREDLDVLALAVVRAEERGRRFLCRTGPSLVRARAGLEPRPPVTGERVRAAAADDRSLPHGLIAVGSHVPLSTRQAEAALRLDDVTLVELDVSRLLDPATREAECARTVEEAVRRLPRADVLLRTSRRLVAADSAEESSAIAASVADGLCKVVTGILRRTRPAFLIGKGGITSSDLLTKALGFRRGWVVGQMFPGKVPVLAREAAPGHAAEGAPPYVIFPGNVGDDGTLAEAVTILREAETTPC